MADWICICPSECFRFPADSPFAEIWETVKLTRIKRETLKEIMKERRNLLRKITKLKNFEKTQKKAEEEEIEDKEKEAIQKEEQQIKQSGVEGEKIETEDEEDEEEEEEYEDDEDNEEKEDGENEENLPMFNVDYFATARKCVECAMDPQEWEVNGKRFNKLWSISMCHGALDKVIEVIREMAKKENSWALYNLGMMICTRVIKNQESFKEGLCYLSRASSLGCPGAYNCLGVFFQTGFSGLKWDPKKAVSLYMSAIKLNCSSAMCNLGELYCEGVADVIEKQEMVGVDLIRRAARAGNPRALYMLGIAYFHSKYGLAKDRKKAAQLIFLGAEAGDPSAQDMMGTIYSMGTPQFKQSFEESFYFFSLSALNNSTAGMRDLGMSYVEGKIVPRDLVKGLFWYNMAAIRGDDPSKKVVSSLEHYFPDEYKDALDKSLDMIKKLHEELTKQH